MLAGRGWRFVYAAAAWRPGYHGPACGGCAGRGAEIVLRPLKLSLNSTLYMIMDTIISRARCGRRRPERKVLFGNSIARLSKRLLDDAIGVEVDLPVVIVVGVRTHRQNWPHGIKRQNLDVWRRIRENVRN